MNDTGMTSQAAWLDALPRAQDLRLVPAAAAVWLAALIGGALSWQWALACGVVAATLGAVRLGRCRPLTLRRPAAVVSGCALLACGIAVAAWMAPRLYATQHNPLRARATHGDHVRLRVEVTEPARPVHDAGFGNSRGGVGSELVSARVLGVVPAHGTARAYGQVLLITPVQGWGTLLRGQRATASGSLRPPYPGEALAGVLRVRGPPRHVTPASPMQRAAEAFREGLRTAARGLPKDEAGLLPGLVLGDRGGIPERVQQDFQTSGMAYLTAVGGWHFMIVCGAVLLLLRLLRASPRASAAVAGAVLAAFLVIAGPRPSVLRAAVMVAAGLLALGMGRARSTLGALALSIIGLVLWRPSFGIDVGFALSVLATGGLLLGVAPATRVLHRCRVPPGFAELIAVATVAHLVTAPVIAGEFGTFSVVSILANVLAEPAFVPAMVLVALALALAPVWAGAAAVLAHVSHPCLAWLVTVAHWTAHLPAASITWPGGWWGGLAMAASILAAGWVLRKLRVRVLAAVALLGLVLLFVPGRVVRPGWPPRPSATASTH
jgi:competence protein ComEC